MQSINASKALFIKLGEGGIWESDCIRDGLLHLDYRSLPHNQCVSSHWDDVRSAFPADANQGSVSRHINQVRHFYEEPSSTLWVTFYSDRLWWCFSNPTVTRLADQSKIRPVIDRWRDTDITGAPLIKGKLSGKLLAVQSFPGTICTIKERQYLLHKINGTSEPHIGQAESAIETLVDALIPIIKNLHPTDLETLTDLLFRQGGWQRTGVAGETEKDIDLDLMSPITQERIAVQVKSKASIAVYQEYRNKFLDMSGFSRFYFVTHSPHPSLTELANQATDDAFVFWGARELARQAARNGLAGWLIDKAS